MSCNDILEKLEKEGIISAEGVIDSYLFCKHVEELFGKSYLKKHNIVLDDDKKEIKFDKMKRLKFKDLDNAHAWFEVYMYVDLLEHELQCIYPDMGNNTVLFQDYI